MSPTREGRAAQTVQNAAQAMARRVGSAFWREVPPNEDSGERNVLRIDIAMASHALAIHFMKMVSNYLSLEVIARPNLG
jgi:hypothetical protein